MATLMSYTLDSDTSEQPDALYKLTAVESARTSTTVTIKFTAYGKLESSAHWLGTGHTLTAAVYVGGEWYSWTLKKSSTSWEGTTAHSASRTIKVSVTTSQTSVTGIKFRVTHSGGTGCHLNAKSVSNLTISTGNTKDSLFVSTTTPVLGESIGMAVGTESIGAGNSHIIKIIRNIDNGDTETTETLYTMPGTYMTGQSCSFTFAEDMFINLFSALSDTVPLEIVCATYDSSGALVGESFVPIELIISEEIGKPNKPSAVITSVSDTSAEITLTQPTEYKYNANFGNWKVITNIGTVDISGNTASVNWSGNENVVATVIALDSRGIKSEPIQVICNVRKKGFCIYNGKWKQASPYLYFNKEYKRLNGAVYNNGIWLKHKYKGPEVEYLLDNSNNYFTDASGNILRGK